MLLSSNSQKARAGVLSALLVGALCLLCAAPAAAQRIIPSDPQNVQVTVGDGALTLTWAAPETWGSFPAGGYQIDWRIETADTWQVNIPKQDDSATSYTFTGTYGTHTVANWTRYQLRIRAYSTNPDDTTDELLSSGVTVSETPNDLPFAPPGKPTVTAITAGPNAPTATTLSFTVTCVSPGSGPVTDYILWAVNTADSADWYEQDFLGPAQACNSITVTMTVLPSRSSATTYRVKARARNITGQRGPWSDPIYHTTPANGDPTPANGDLDQRPEAFGLVNNHPNPFNPTTTIRYALPQAADVELTVYNALGQPVRTLVAEHQSAGHYAVEWDATGLSSGLYFYRLQADAFHAVDKMLLLQ